MKRFAWILSASAICLAQTNYAPSLLSRGALPEASPSRVETVLQPSVGVLSGYDNGPLTTSLARAGGPFEEIEGGLEARRLGRRTNLRLDYQFGLRHYTSNSSLDRSNHGFNLDARFFLSPRWSLNLRDVGTSSSFGSSFQASPSALSSGFFLDSGTEVFHSRTIANTALADLVFSPSARTSASVAGDGFIVQRQFRSLADAIGWRARADVAHRYARHKTVSLSYSFTHFDHSRMFGGADYAVYAFGHSVRLSKTAELDLLGGAGYLRSAGVRAVQLDPEIAALLGTSRGAEIFRVSTWTPHLVAAWVQGIGRAELRVEFARVVSDGGGLTGVARQNQGSIMVQAARSRSWRASAHLAARRLRSLDTLLYDNTMAVAGATLARRLTNHTEAVWRYQFAFYNFQRGLLHDFRRHEAAAGIICYFRDLRKQ